MGKLSRKFGGLNAFFNATIANAKIAEFGIFNSSGVYPFETYA
jgi:hypothetical protein